MKERIICVLVLYNPDLSILSKAIDAILPQIDVLWISDNSPYPIELSVVCSCVDKVIYQKMEGNVGIAAAQNAGLRYAIYHHFDFVYLLDQDSISPNDIIQKLGNAYCKLVRSGYNVGAVGPRAFNRGEGKEYRGRIKRGVRIDDGITEVSELISSASFIPVRKFQNTGLMDASLFIDGVDHEWCWRSAHKTGSRFFIVEDAKLSHQLGEGDRYFLWIKVAIPTPFRTYYQFRNYFLLFRRTYVPLYWKISNGVKYLVKLFYYPLFLSPHRKYLHNVLKGICDGIVLKSSSGAI